MKNYKQKKNTFSSSFLPFSLLCNSFGKQGTKKKVKDSATDQSFDELILRAKRANLRDRHTLPRWKRVCLPNFFWDDCTDIFPYRTCPIFMMITVSETGLWPRRESRTHVKIFYLHWLRPNSGSSVIRPSTHWLVR